jgi:hypothetical protein
MQGYHDCVFEYLIRVMRFEKSTASKRLQMQSSASVCNQVQAPASNY